MQHQASLFALIISFLLTGLGFLGVGFGRPQRPKRDLSYVPRHRGWFFTGLSLGTLALMAFLPSVWWLAKTNMPELPQGEIIFLFVFFGIVAPATAWGGAIFGSRLGRLIRIERLTPIKRS